MNECWTLACVVCCMNPVQCTCSLNESMCCSPVLYMCPTESSHVYVGHASCIGNPLPMLLDSDSDCELQDPESHSNSMAYSHNSTVPHACGVFWFQHIMLKTKACAAV